MSLCLKWTIKCLNLFQQSLAVLLLINSKSFIIKCVKLHELIFQKTFQVQRCRIHNYRIGFYVNNFF